MAYAHAQRRELEKMTDTHPYWRYRVGLSRVHRQDHVARDGMILRWDDPWWDEHFPPDGYGCNCYVQPVSRSKMEDMGKIDPDGNIVPDIPPPDAVKKPELAIAPANPTQPSLTQVPSNSALPKPNPAQPVALPTSGTLPNTPDSKPKEPVEPNAPKPVTRRISVTDFDRTAYCFPPIQPLLESLAKGYATYAAQFWEKVKKRAVLIQEQRRFNRWVKPFLPIGNETDHEHKHRIRKLPGYNEEWIIGMFEPHVLAFVEKQMNHPIANAAFGTTGERIGHAMRPSKGGYGGRIHEYDLFRLMQLLASPSEVYWDDIDKNLIYVFNPDSKTQVKHGVIGDKIGKIAVWIDAEKKIREKGRKVKRRINRMATMGIINESNLAHPRYIKIPKSKSP